MDETGEGSPKKDPQDPLAKARQLLERKGNEPTAISTPNGVALDVFGIIEVIDGMEQISLANAQKGDVAWWKTESGSSGCLLIEEPYEDRSKEGQVMKYGKGDILITRDPTHPLGEQRGKGTIRGATVGSSLKVGTIIKGKPVDFSLTETNKPEKVYTSSPVVDMGIIKAASLNQA